MVFISASSGTWAETSSKAELTSTSKTPLTEALSLLPSDKEKALGILKSIPPNDKDFKIALEEALKIQYQKSDWPSFFGLAQYYRKAFELRDRSEGELLEVLALLRHCQNDLVDAFSQYYRVNQNKYIPSLDQIEALSRTRFKGKSKKGDSLAPLQRHFEGEALWKTDTKTMMKTNPYRIRVKVKNLCLDS